MYSGIACCSCEDVIDVDGKAAGAAGGDGCLFFVVREEESLRGFLDVAWVLLLLSMRCLFLIVSVFMDMGRCSR